ncbi:MAG: hypothetical protein E6K81_16585 [Candidatus Eisenbacteria bacterium]|uniref:Peptidase C-terminal archaeal/bacterial domain-containing protein n=1 Tax=Eiseniibacteriota bacterium TaxID=2212470 RepID=A0A538TXU0_UNCEI|nr:MAG: hypothetical protein E6K81_16585 [Candidatus Eisenbacteria bacterium]
MRRLALLLAAVVLLGGACSKISRTPTGPDVSQIQTSKPELPATLAAQPLAVAATVVLTNGVPVTGISDIAGGLRYYTLAVPSGQTQAVFKITGSSGDCDIYVKFGAQPTTSTYDYRPFTNTSNETVTVNNPAAGTWYVMLRGYTAYSGVTLTGSYTASPTSLPDLTVYAAGASPYIETRTFSSTNCAVLEGTVVAGTRRLLRFNAETRNQGTADLYLGSPSAHPELFVYDTCHDHYHFIGYIAFSLLDANNALVAGGQKVAFCIEDFSKFSSSAGPAKYDCNNQGMSVGWADIYSANLDGQWIDITNVAAGTYTLQIVVDPLHKLPEQHPGDPDHERCPRHRPQRRLGVGCLLQDHGPGRRHAAQRRHLGRVGGCRSLREARLAADHVGVRLPLLGLHHQRERRGHRPGRRHLVHPGARLQGL